MELTDGISEHLLRTVMKNAKILMDEPQCYKARAEVMWAGSLSHNGLMACGNDGGDWACHQLEHELGGMFDVAHGAGLAAVWEVGRVTFVTLFRIGLNNLRLMLWAWKTVMTKMQ